MQGLNGHEQLTTYLSILYGETNEVVKGLLEQAEIKRQAVKQISGELNNDACDSDYLLSILMQLLKAN